MKLIHKQMVAFQKDLLAKQTVTFDKQNSLIQKQMDVLIKLNTLLDKNIKFFNHSVSVIDHGEAMESVHDVNDYHENMESVNDKENDFTYGNQSIIGERAALHYNDIRSGFNFLSLKTPAKLAEATALTPKTPKSLLSRTLQMQLGDIFEES